MNQQNLPGASTITTLWIIGLLFLFAGCCCGPFGAVPAMILSIIGLVMVKKNSRLFHENPGEFVGHTLNSVKTGKVMHIIILILSGIIVLFTILYFALYGVAFWSGMYDVMDQERFNDYEYQEETYDDVEEGDEDFWSDDAYKQWEEDADSVYNDTIFIEEVQIDSITN